MPADPTSPSPPPVLEGTPEGSRATPEPPRPAARAPAQAAGTSAAASRWPWSLGSILGRSSDNMDSLKALFFGLVMTAVVYEIFPLPFIDDRRIHVDFSQSVAKVWAKHHQPAAKRPRTEST